MVYEDDDEGEQQQIMAYDEVERSLITGDLERLDAITSNSSSDVSSDILDVARLLLCDDYAAAMSHDAVVAVLVKEEEHDDNVSDGWCGVSRRIQKFLSKAATDSDGDLNALSMRELQLRVLLSAIACFNVYTQLNYTGPELPNELDALALPKRFTGDAASQTRLSALAELSTGGEDAYRLVEQPVLLAVAVSILANALDLCPSAKWWKVRLLVAQQQLLDEDIEELHDNTLALMDSVILDKQFLQLCDGNEDNSTDDGRSRQINLLAARARLEFAVVLQLYKHFNRSREEVSLARDLAGLRFRMTGALGKRTQWQQKELAQLVLEAETDTNSATFAVDSVTPKELALNDDTLLENVAITEPTDKMESSLSPLNQALLLSACQDVRNTNPKNGLTAEEMFPYVSRVLKHTQNWMVTSMALLVKSRLEVEKSRTVERGCLQMQVLVDQYNDAEPGVAERMIYLHGLNFPSRWALQRELGERFLKLGAARTALELFERLELWEDMVTCYIVMDQNSRAEELLKRELARHETPKLWCLLGDTTEDPQHYRTAWELSGHRFARAQRSLGYWNMKRQEFGAAIEAFDIALEKNPLSHGVWFSCGCACMCVQDYQKAVVCFRKAVQIEPEDGESWNNLGTAYIRLENKHKAAQALWQAIRNDFENWRVWENYLYVCTDIGNFADVIRSYNRMLDIKPKFVDSQVLSILVNSVVHDVEDIEGRSAERHMDDVLRLLARATSLTSNDAEMWRVFAKLYRANGDLNSSLQCRTRAYQAECKAGWETSLDGFHAVANSALETAEAMLDTGIYKHIHAAKLMLRPLIKKTLNSFGNESLYDRLQNLLDDVVAAESASREEE